MRHVFAADAFKRNRYAGACPIECAIGYAEVRQARTPSRDEIGPDTPLRLAVAAVIAFTEGSMTTSGVGLEGASTP